MNTGSIEVYLENGQKKVFAGAMDWPGWCRAGRDEESALSSLLDYAERYASLLKGTSLDFHLPKDVSEFKVVEEVKGNATTDFGAPDNFPASDGDPIGDEELRRLKLILEACWQALEQAEKKASGKELSKGPRGGGRELEGIKEHVLGSAVSYLSKLGGKLKTQKNESLDKLQSRIRQEVVVTLDAAVRGDIPLKGPRGGDRWPPRSFLRRFTWHLLDHVWEIEDRIVK